ncbi:hypothetical protein M1403_02030 [Patescibacteria group bacterium]|nr:hypothetical protein [Patescibacteria group bacterium]
MPKFKTSRSFKRPDFNPTGFRKFQDFRAKEKFTTWSQSAAADNFIRLFIIVWFVPLLLATIFAAFNFRLLPSQIPLFYSRNWGEDQLAAKSYIFIPLAGTLLLGIFNFGLAINFHVNDRVSSYLLGGTAALVSLLAAITTVNIINLIK